MAPPSEGNLYSGHGLKTHTMGDVRWGIGDLDVIRHEGLYHLFHLVLPNHAYIAHAVSRDGLQWRRVENALFIGDPDGWDDDMLWTMHVSPDPYRAGRWRMFYTGLARAELGRYQRIGLAYSDDLYRWSKHEGGDFPLLPSPEHYESAPEQGRLWLSFRDPFFGQVNGERWLLAAARASHGPVLRRGCVALAREVAENRFEFAPPLFYPHRYDDIEVPSLVALDGRHYLIGSIREDVKVHYWYSDRPEGPYENFADNVLLPQGNYAARTCRQDGGYLVWNFFHSERATGFSNVLPPPKELVTTPEGALKLAPYRAFDRYVDQRHTLEDLLPLSVLCDNPTATAESDERSCRCAARSGFEVFMLRGRYRHFRMSGTFSLETDGKCGFVLRLDDQGNGYYISLDPYKGLVQLRAWGLQTETGQIDFLYRQLQADFYVPEGSTPASFQLTAFGQYLELALNRHVLLTLADDTYVLGKVGFYAESGDIRVKELVLEELREPHSKGYDPMV